MGESPPARLTYQVDVGQPKVDKRDRDAELTPLAHLDEIQEQIIGRQPQPLRQVDRLPATLELLLASMAAAFLVGVVLGVLSALWQGRWPDLLVRTSSIAGVSMPAFHLGLVLQILFFRNLGWLPLAGRLTTDLRFTHPVEPLTGFLLIDALVGRNWVALADAAEHLILPGLTLAAYPIGLIARMTRASMLEVLSQDYIRTARAYGLPERTVVYLYALKNAVGPTITVLGLTMAYALTGTFFVEVVFNWPGLGLFTVRSLLNVDYPAIMGITLLGAAGYVVINLLVDLAQAWLDPRVRLQ